MLAATGRANIRLDEIGTELEHAARENVLAPLVAAGFLAAGPDMPSRSEGRKAALACWSLAG